jgi:ribosomal protein L21E
MQDKEEIEILSLRVKNLRIQLSEAEAHLAMKEKEAKAKAALKEKEAIAKAERMATAVPLVLKEKETKAKVDRRADGIIAEGDHVRISWDRVWKYNRHKSKMPITEYQGSTGLVIRVTECFAWVRLDDTNKVLKKAKHNVALLTSES